MKKMNSVITVSKLDASRRQIDAAIKLFLTEGDQVSIHTLISAAYRIIIDLSDKDEIKSMHGAYCKSVKESKLSEDRKREYILRINAAQNFFKHADKDPKDQIEFNPSLSELYIYDAINIYFGLTGERTLYMKTYTIWYHSAYPEILDRAQLLAIDSIQRDLNLNPKYKFSFLSNMHKFDGVW